jgi:Type II secretory pathway, prepilin signal peptidase PulO and related peptidases
MSTYGALLPVLAVGAVAGLLLRTRLSAFGHRRPEECGLPIRRTDWVIPATALLSVFLWLAVRQTQPLLVAMIFVLAGWIMIALAFIDLDVHRLPDAIQLPSYPILLALLVIGAIATGGWSAAARAVIAGIVLFAFYFLLLLLPSGFGFGDVKLAGLLGMLLGWLGWSSVVRATFATFIIGGLVAVGVMFVRDHGRKDEFAYGPSMLAGAVVAIVLSALSG